MPHNAILGNTVVQKYIIEKMVDYYSTVLVAIFLFEH